MEPLAVTTIIILQIAAASLHGYLVLCFYPDRHEHPALNNFMWAMILCALFHLTDATLDLFTLFGWHSAASVAYMAHLLVEYSLCPFMVSNLMAQYTKLPDKPNIIAQLLQTVSLNAKPLSYIVLVIAYGSLGLRVADASGMHNFNELTFYSFHADFLVITLGLIWLLMIASGLRPSEQSYGYKREPVLWIRIAFIVFILLALTIDEFYGADFGGYFNTASIHFVTVPFAISFAWYRYRWILVDVIIKRTISLFVILAAIWFGVEVVPVVDANARPMVIFLIAVCTIFIARYSGYFLDSLWMPRKYRRNQFRREFPLKIGQCINRTQSIETTEQSLAELFEAKVAINKQTDDKTVEVITIDEEPVLRIELGYIKGHYPWFSETLAIANEVALYLHNHLKVLELRAVQHQQELSNRELETLAARAERDAMRAQIRPHFLFNVLNTLHNFVQQQPKQAEKIIELLADLMRGVIRSSSEDTYPLYKEIDLAKTYLKIEKIRHGDRLSFDFDERLLSHPILPFSIQPLVENAVKYSLDTQLGRAEINVTVLRKNSQLLAMVTDNGPGPMASHSGEGLGMALNNIRERLNKLYGDRGSLLLEAGKKTGTKAILSMPWLGAEQYNADAEVAICPSPL